MRFLIPFFVAFALCACRSEPAAPSPVTPTAHVVFGEGAPWRLESSEPRVSLAGPEGLSLFLDAAARADDGALPGLTLGDARGPRYGLLGGYYAPFLVAPDTSAAWALEVSAAAEGVTVRGTSPTGALRWRVLPIFEERVRVVLDAGGTLMLPASRTRLTGTFEGRPAFGLEVTAGERPSFTKFRADRVEIQTDKLGVVVVQTNCTEVVLVRPIPRGSTSVFALHFGPAAPPTDPVYAPEAPPPELQCAPASTTTISVPWPLPS